ncbi:MAG: protein transport protein S31 [Trizodia sp. TS-e1964]|nr:MAG: protein transport protein S31 [Trizodia sp. TS-e1964]
MVRLREISRTAAFAWSPGSGLPFIATGTRAGAVDADFSDETKLEIWDLGLGDKDQGVELQPAASITTDSRFHDIAWGRVNQRGILAGALENGSLDLWNADALLSGADGAFMSRTTKHSGAIKSLHFNTFKPELLATAGAKGELFISDINNVDNPFRLGASAARADDYECVEWNKKLAAILATGGSGGFVTVFDVRTKKVTLTLNNLGRKAVGALAWDPENPTNLITATPDDSDPVILLWDLRNSNAPKLVLKGHEQGVLSLSWCQQDSDLLLSCGKDNRTICWNPQTGQAYGEFPMVTNWTFQTRFNPRNPSLLATASFDGKIAIHTLQNTKPAAGQANNGQPLDGEDFFMKAQREPQGEAFSLRKAPKWLERPTGVSFGYGGKIVSFGPIELPDSVGPGPKPRRSEIRISKYAVDSGVGNATETFEEALKTGDIASICESRIADAKTDEEKADWKVMETLISENPRKQLVDYLGFSGDDEVEEKKKEPAAVEPAADPAVDEIADTIAPLPTALEEGEDVLKDTTNGVRNSNRLSAFFESGVDGEGDGFLSELGASKEAKPNNPFQIYTGNESASDRQISKSLMLGQFEKALDICLKENRMSDAFMVAICGGQKCIDKAQAAYFSAKSGGPNYLRLLSSVVGKDLGDIVHNADLKNWKEVIATICTYADETEFPNLCEALGDRLEDELKHGSSSSDHTTLRKDAAFCYLVGSKLEKVVAIWIDDLKAYEQSGLQEASTDSTFSIHARSLQTFIEKVTVFREVTKFQDTEQTKSSGWKLAPLYDKYAEYADVVASHGLLEVAAKYLDLLPAEYPAAQAAKNRVEQASGKAIVSNQPESRQPATATRSAPVPQPAGYGGYQPGQQQQPLAAAAITPSPYAPVGAGNAPGPYAPQNPAPYGTPGYQQSYQRPAGGIPTPQPFAGHTQQQYSAGYGDPPPARHVNQPLPPPPKAKEVSNWNDTPIVTKPPTSRRGTPNIIHAPGISPYSNQLPQNMTMNGPPMQAPYGAQQRNTPPPPPPPPKGPAPPPRISSPLAGPGYQQHFQQPERPSPSANAYAPQPQHQQLGGMSQPPTIPRGPSPYNAPPSAPPPSNRYAPAPSSQGPAQGLPSPQQQGLQRGPPPNPYAQSQGQQFPGPQQGGPSTYAPAQPPQGGPSPYAPVQPPQGGPGSYAPNQPRQGIPGQYAPAPSPYAPPQPPQGQYAPGQVPQGGPGSYAAGQIPSQGPPPQQISRPGTGQSQAAKPATPAPSKYPAGDRSHISAAGQPIFAILSVDMQRVKSKAPAAFKVQVNDTEKRLNILFDHLNNDDMLKPDTVEEMAELARALQARNYDEAQQIHLDILKRKQDECGNWMVCQNITL